MLGVSMRSTTFLLLVLTACGPGSVKLSSAAFTFETVRGREGTATSAVTGSTLDYDASTREVKLTLNGAARRFVAAMSATTTTGCHGNFGGVPQETRTLDAPNIQVGEFLIDAPLIRTDCPQGSPLVVLQSGPVGATGAPDCSADVICLVYRKK